MSENMQDIAIVVTALVAFGVTAILGKVLIPYLRKLKFGQTIKEIGPTWHKAKQGTPTMGGMMFIIGIISAVVVGFITMISVNQSGVNNTQCVRLFAGLIMAFGFGLMGYVDDYIKVVKKRNLGLKAKQKLLIQLFLSIAYLAVLKISGTLSTIVDIPFVGQLDLSLFYYPAMIFVIIATTNAVNLTDGIDGLASSVTFIVAIAFMIYSSKMNQDYMQILSIATAAGCLGFLVWNFYPAKVFMGDTGSMFLGGLVVALAFGLDVPILIILVGFIYFIEALSVILQVISFKTTGKRIFKMSPIHHHFEMSGWSEIKIVVVFCLISAIFGVIGFFGLPI